MCMYVYIRTYNIICSGACKSRTCTSLVSSIESS